MVVDDALGVAGRARRVVERDRVPLVRRHLPGEIRIAALNERLVVDVGELLARLRKFLVVVVDDDGAHLGESERILAHRRELAIRDHDLGVGMIELEGDDRRIESRIDRVQDRARHRHAEVGFEHRGGVGQHHRDGIAHADAEPAQG